MQSKIIIKSLLSGLALTITVAFPCKNEEVNKETTEQVSSSEPKHDITNVQKNITKIKAFITAHKSQVSSSDFVTIINSLNNDFSNGVDILKSLVEQTAPLPTKLTAKKEALRTLDEDTRNKFEGLMQDKATHQASLAAKQEHVNALLTTITELTQKIADVDAQILSHTNNIRDLNALNEQTADALIGDIDQLISIHQSLKAAHDQAVAEVNDVVQQFPQDNEHIKALLAAIRDQVCSCKEGRF